MTLLQSLLLFGPYSLFRIDWHSPKTRIMRQRTAKGILTERCTDPLCALCTLYRFELMCDWVRQFCVRIYWTLCSNCSWKREPPPGATYRASAGLVRMCESGCLQNGAPRDSIPIPRGDFCILRRLAAVNVISALRTGALETGGKQRVLWRRVKRGFCSRKQDRSEFDRYSPHPGHQR